MRHIPAVLLFLTSTALAAQQAPARAGVDGTPTDLVYEASITDLQRALTARRTTSVQLVDAYLARIRAYDHQGPSLNAMIRLNPRARADAAALDAERRAGTIRGPLHGIPVILKDNYSTRGLATSAGSVALAGLQTPDDAFQVKKLRDAGAIILGKSNMHELASGITSISSIGGQTCNPYDPDRSPGGSSGGSGAAVAASFAAVAWGSDTCGSIRIPSAVHNLFGLRPTKGLSSISGIVPLSHSQDVGGPIARTVRDLAIALDATVGADPADTATKILEGSPPPSFVAALDSTSLRGKRFGLFTEYLGTEQDDAEGARVIRQAVAALRARGAEVVDVKIPGLDSVASSAGVIPYEFKYDLIDFLAAIPNAPVPSLAKILETGAYHVALEGALRTRETQGTRDSPAYLAALAARAVTRDMVVSFLDANHLDALLYPTLRRKAAYIGEVQRGSTCQISAVSGLPALSMPAGFTPDGMPIGIELLGRPLSDASLVSFAYDYETATHPRRPPSTTPPLVGGRTPAPRTFAAAAVSAGIGASASLSYDAPHRRLTYAVSVRGAPAASVYAISINRDSAGRPGPATRVLSGPGTAAARGTVKLTDAERRDLVAGRATLVVYTERRPLGELRASIRPKRSRGRADDVPAQFQNSTPADTARNRSKD
jgi:Asp-tRNA(Asn)/Glu-tRNA(Gln) amidotransferase A subunit family amidase